MTKQKPGASTIRKFSGGVVHLNGIESCRRLSSSAWDVHYEQFSPGPFELELTYLSTVEAILCRERVSSGFRMTGALQPGLVAVITADSKTVSDGKWWNGAHPANCVSIVSGGGEVDIVFPPGSSTLITLFRESDFRRFSEEVVGIGEETGFFALKPGGMEMVRQNWNRLLDKILAGTSRTRPASFSSRLMKIFLGQIEVPGKILSTSSNRGGLLKRALEIAEIEGFEIPVSVLCDRLNASRRTLEYTFRDSLGVGPATYLKLHRLNQCRTRLARSDSDSISVQAIARASGFRGSGKFAAAYSELFGELPAETLKRTATNVEPAFVLDPR